MNTNLAIRKKEERASVIPIDSRFKKSNYLISAVSRASLLEVQITNFALYKIWKGEFELDGKAVICDIPAKEIRDYVDGNSGSFYKKLDPVALSMNTHVIGWTDPELQEFDYMSLITRARYKSGVFHIEFNQAVTELISNPQKHFTILALDMLKSFKTVYAYNLYEKLSMKTFHPTWASEIQKQSNLYEITYSLAQLRFYLGLVNPEFEPVKKVLQKATAPNWEKAYELCPEKNYETWFEFKRNVLDPSVKNINDVTDIYVEYEPIKEGSGAKVRKIRFFVKKFKNTEEQQKYRTEEENIIDIEKKPKLSMEEKEDMIFDVGIELSEFLLKRKDIKAICEAAEYNKEKILQAYSVVKASGHINNVVGFMIKAIQEGYQNKGYDAPQKFNNFEQRSYDMNEIEKMLLLKNK